MRPRPSIRPVLLVSALLAGPIFAARPSGLLARDVAGANVPPPTPDVAAHPEAPAAPPAPSPSQEAAGSAEVRKLDAEVAKAGAETKDAGPDASTKPGKVAAIPTPAEIARATPEEAGRMFAAVEARLKALDAPEVKGKPENKPIREVLEERKRRLLEWRSAAKEHHEANHPEPSPERQAADARADLEKSKALLDQAAKSPDAPLPEPFRAAPARAKASEARLAEMKEAIDAARAELKERAAALEQLRAESSRAADGDVVALRAKRDQLHQEFSTLTARRAEREEAVASAASPEARDLAAERLANFEWEARAVAERLDTQEARIALAARQLDANALLLQAGEARVRLCRKALERMEWHYSRLAEAQQKALDQAVAQEQARAALVNDPILRHRARRKAELLELESQVVAHEKALAATDGLSLQDQKGLADAAELAFAKLKKMLEDGNLTTLEALRFKNEYRRIGAERDRVARTDLAGAVAELTAYENALSDAEIDLANDTRDDRFEFDALIEKVEAGRRDEAIAMLDELEVKHRRLLERRCNALKALAERAEATHAAVLRRVRLLDQENAFIRTHIFWVRDAEPLGKATLLRARGEAGRLIRALTGLAVQACDRRQWGEPSVAFLAAATVAVFLPLPLWFGRRWIDRRRVAQPA